MTRPKPVSVSRAVLLGEYVKKTGCTVRQAAAKFGIGKSTVHKDLTVRLRMQNKPLYEQVRSVLQRNKQERHKRGGNATKLKYLHKKH